MGVPGESPFICFVTDWLVSDGYTYILWSSVIPTGDVRSLYMYAAVPAAATARVKTTTDTVMIAFFFMICKINPFFA